MSLRDLVREVHGPSKVIPSIDIFLRRRVEEERTGWHPSNFCDMCPRAHVIKELVHYKDQSTIDPRLRRIFDIGTGIHYLYQNYYLGPMGILWGKWRCRVCGKIQWGFMPTKEHRCVNVAKSNTWEYREVPVKSEREVGKGRKKRSYVINGHSDGLVFVDKVWKTLELKSINDRGFSKLSVPQGKHLLQAEIYAQLILDGAVEKVGKSAPKPEETLIFYVNKNNCKEAEFSRPVNSDVGRRALENPEISEKAFLKEELPAKHPDCRNLIVPRAKDCKVATQCFSSRVTWNSLLTTRRKRYV